MATADALAISTVAALRRRSSRNYSEYAFRILNLAATRAQLDAPGKGLNPPLVLWDGPYCRRPGGRKRLSGMNRKLASVGERRTPMTR